MILPWAGARSDIIYIPYACAGGGCCLRWAAERRKPWGAVRSSAWYSCGGGGSGGGGGVVIYTIIYMVTTEEGYILYRKKTCSMLVRAKFRYFSSSCLPRFGVRTAACGLTDTDEKIRGKNTRESKDSYGGKGRGSDTLLPRRTLADGNLIQK